MSDRPADALRAFAECFARWECSCDEWCGPEIELCCISCRARAALRAADTEPDRRQSVAALAYDLITLPDVVLQNDPLLIARDLLDRMGLPLRDDEPGEITAYRRLQLAQAPVAEWRRPPLRDRP